MPISPMLATSSARVPSGPEWVHEVKWDGMRVLADVHDGRLTLTSRNGNDVTTAYPELAPLATLYVPPARTLSSDSEMLERLGFGHQA